MISVKAFVAFEAQAQRALERGDLWALEQVNQIPELVRANMRFFVRDGRLWVGRASDVKDEEEVQQP